MEMQQCEAEMVAKRRHIILDKATFLEKIFKFYTLNDSCGHKRNKTMTNM
jgi:hypothetical protein